MCGGLKDRWRESQGNPCCHCSLMVGYATCNNICKGYMTWHDKISNVRRAYNTLTVFSTGEYDLPLQNMFGLVVFYGISTLVGYLIPSWKVY